MQIKSTYKDEVLTLEYNDGVKMTFPIEMVMKQDYQTLKKIYLVIDRKYFFNSGIVEGILTQITKIEKKGH